MQTGIHLVSLFATTHWVSLCTFLLAACPYLDFLFLSQSSLCLSLHSSEYWSEKKSLAAMQPQNFLKAINGQTVDSYSGFFVLSHSLRGREGCLTCVSLTQNCSDVGARCVCAVLCNVLPVSPYNCHQYVRWHVEAHRSGRSDSASPALGGLAISISSFQFVPKRVIALCSGSLLFVSFFFLSQGNLMSRSCFLTRFSRNRESGEQFINRWSNKTKS